MLKHDLHQTLIKLEESISEGLNRLEEYGVRLRRRPAPVVEENRVGEDLQNEQLRLAGRWLAIGAGITVGLAAGLIAISYFRSQRHDGVKRAS